MLRDDLGREVVSGANNGVAPLPQLGGISIPVLPLLHFAVLALVLLHDHFFVEFETIVVCVTLFFLLGLILPLQFLSLLLRGVIVANAALFFALLSLRNILELLEEVFVILDIFLHFFGIPEVD